MDNLNKKQDEILLTEEEEPVPEEYKDLKLQIPLNNKNYIKQSNINTIISSNQNINKKLYTDNNNNNIQNKNNSNSITLSHVSKAKTSMTYFDNSKYENYNLEKMRYNFLKDYSYIHVNKDENFLNRMKFDIHKRQIKEEKINELIEQNKIKIDEDERITAFNRLISDANRRLEAQENLENMKNKLSEDLINNEKKKYNNEIWNEIYNKRFKKYFENCNKKKEEKIKIKEIKKLKEENDEINLCKSKKKPQKLIDEASKRMYDEAKKRKIKMNEKIDRINKYNNEIEDASKYTKKIKSESYTFIDDENINNNFGNNDIDNNRLSYNDFYAGKKINNNKEKIKKTKGMSVAEFNNKRFDKRPRTGKSYNNKNVNNKMNQKYFNDYMKRNEQYFNNDNNINTNIKKNRDKSPNSKINNNIGVGNIVEQFFLRQFNDNDD